MAASRPPVIVVIFDALPVHLLEDDHGRIDAVRFPNFAAFAQDGTWYRNATTVSEATQLSIPAMLDGRRPRPGSPPTLVGHPVNLFTLLAPHYRLNVWEEATRMCPCLPNVRGRESWRLHHQRATRFRRAIARITRGRRPQLTFIHAFLPHEPRQYLPDGRQYRAGRGSDALGGPPSYDNEFLTEQVEQRELLQLEFVDRLVGELIARLKRERVYDNALIALMSDHGESFAVDPRPAPPFRAGVLGYRRAATERNLQDIAGIAMFVKYPHEHSRGVPDDRFVRHVDLLPTLLRVAGIAQPPALIGHDLFDASYRGHRDVAVEKQDGSVIAMPAARWSSRVRAARQHELSLFGFGVKSLYDFGPAPQLLHVPVAQLTVVRGRRAQAAVEQAPLLADVHPNGQFIPAQVFGTLAGAGPPGETLAFALNGTVVATAPSFAPPRGTKLNFSALLPPDAFKPGRNHLEIFQVLRGRTVRRLYG